jgi:tRNA(Ile)-lysidine synthase
VTDKTELSPVFERALKDIFTRVSVLGNAEPKRIAIGYSGGLDSSVLLHLAARCAREHGILLHAFHVHHGISGNADAWLAHCRAEAAKLNVAFDAKLVNIGNAATSGVEEAARLLRYAALGELCRKHEVHLLLTAHHRDDQAETLLLQLLRGSGVAGLSGMELANKAPDLLGDDKLIMGRPMLDATREALEGYAAEHSVAHIVDESNADPRYARNALRHHVMPALAACFPGYQDRFARSTTHMQAAHRLLNELAAGDLETCRDGDCLLIDKLQALNMDRIDNLLRYWLSSRGLRMPSTAWLAEMRKQLLQAQDDASVCVSHADGQIRRYRGRVYLTPVPELPFAEPIAFTWQGEAQIPFPSYGGVLHFQEAEQGFSAAWLRQQQLQIRHRQGGERLKPASNRSTRSLKHHYQFLNVPPWQRERLPLVFARDYLLYAAGIGMDCRQFSEQDEIKIALAWKG